MANPGLQVTPAVLLGFVAEKTKQSPVQDSDSDEDFSEQERHLSKSPFDVERRQRSTHSVTLPHQPGPNDQLQSIAEEAMLGAEAILK